ncbi:hypothetical protein ACQ3I4_14025 [Zafaria sp. Z1313]|uniref:hypothetical protein n=1 Tax=Zafaria sp. Z1313 TaxID=3423202 RepID=UPI003D30397F
MSDEDGSALSRRALREKRRAAQADASGLPVEPPAAGAAEAARPAAPGPAAPVESEEETARRVARANRSRRAAPGPVDAVPERSERTSLQRARDREALRRQRSLASYAPEPVSPGDDPSPMTRRELRLRALAAARAAMQEPGTAVGGTGPATQDDDGATPADPGGGPAGGASDDAGAAPVGEGQMSVEEALAARRAAAVGDGAEGPAASETGLIDLEVLARQREHAARAAIINRRVAERRRLEAANSQRLEQVRSDPFTGAMNQLRDARAERELANTGVHGPLTSGVSIELPRAAMADARRLDADRSATTGHGTGAEADAVEGGAVVPGRPTADADTPRVVPASEQDAAPVQARSAQGLEPLDYLTAGGRRANRVLLLSVAALALGAATFLAGLVLFINSL